MLVKWVAEEQIANFPKDLIAEPRSAVLHWSSARDISLRYSLLCPSKPFWLHCGLFFFPLWTRVTPTCPDCSASPFGLVWSCLGAMNLSGFRTTDRGFEENVTFDRGYTQCLCLFRNAHISHLFRPYFETSCVISEVSAKWWTHKMERLLPGWPREYTPPPLPPPV